MKSIQDKVEILFHETLSTQLKDRILPFRIIAAFSGGPDSTALLFLLKRFQKDFGYDLEAAYVNHGIRPLSETSIEDNSVKKLTLDLQIPLHIKKLSSGLLKQYASRKHCGLEGAARLFRYRFFKKLQTLSPPGSVTALGHNRNDQEETIIMRLFSGAGLDGLKGIPESREALIRPLIHIDRDSLIQYLEF
ncbi:tRNA lysidine(34) synthetase TilS, partial [Oceanispirochaeta sp.]|uniref:tRNA lysidine(34) synthetase TilS n=1 Tax=Oceanispirochaeta sp. TaxID=2035350 RepID=UPI002609EA3F